MMCPAASRLAPFSLPTAARLAAPGSERAVPKPCKRVFGWGFTGFPMAAPGSEGAVPKPCTCLLCLGFWLCPVARKVEANAGTAALTQKACTQAWQPAWCRDSAPMPLQQASCCLELRAAKAESVELQTQPLALSKAQIMAAAHNSREPQAAALRACEGASSGRLMPASAVIATASGCSSGSAALAPSAACACRSL